MTTSLSGDASVDATESLPLPDDPEQLRYILSQLRECLLRFEMESDKFRGIVDDGERELKLQRPVTYSTELATLPSAHCRVTTFVEFVAVDARQYGRCLSPAYDSFLQAWDAAAELFYSQNDAEVERVLVTHRLLEIVPEELRLYYACRTLVNVAAERYLLVLDPFVESLRQLEREIVERLGAEHVQARSDDRMATASTENVGSAADGAGIENLLDEIGTVMLDDNGAKILAIAREQKDTDGRMRRICAVDPRFISKKSPWWSKILNVTEQAVRNARYWRVDRKELLGID